LIRAQDAYFTLHLATDCALLAEDASDVSYNNSYTTTSECSAGLRDFTISVD